MATKINLDYVSCKWTLTGDNDMRLSHKEHNVAGAEAYLRAHFILITILQRNRQTDRTGQTGQRSDSIRRTVSKTVTNMQPSTSALRRPNRTQLVLSHENNIIVSNGQKPPVTLARQSTIKLIHPNIVYFFVNVYRVHI